MAGDRERAAGALSRIEAEAARQSSLDPSFDGYLRMSRMWVHFFDPRGELALALTNARTALALCEETRDPIGLPSGYYWAGCAEAAAGHFEDAKRLFECCITTGETANILSSVARAHLGLMHVISGDERIGFEELAREAERTSYFAGIFVRSFVAQAKLLCGDAHAARTEASALLELVGGIPFHSLMPLTTMAMSSLALGNPGESLGFVERAFALPVHSQQITPYLEQTRAEALMALGRTELAREAVRGARERVLRVAATLDERDRGAYLNGVRPNARILALADDWLGS
jgi:hypothetical protein